MNNDMQSNDVGDAFGRSTDDTYYNMNHSKRGVALIFNHKFFTASLGLESRDATEVDCEKLTLTLENLGFEVNAFHNLLHKDVVKQLERVAEMDHSEHDCLVIAVLSHGKLGYLCAYDTTYEADSLWHYFTADKCQTLVGKPKLFFIQACQGNKLDPGINLRETSRQYLAISCSDLGTRCHYQEEEENLRERTETDELPYFASEFRIFTQPDFLIAYATIPGYYSWRHTSEGSWFIQALCKKLRDNGTNCDLLTLLTSVCQHVALEFESYNPRYMDMHPYKQIPCITTTLTRLVKFTSSRN